MIARSRFGVAVVATLALAACSGGGGGKSLTNVIPAQGSSGTLAPAQKLSIAGVGDSLTAGTQSDGTMGADLPVLGVDPTLGQIGPVQRTQEHGFFALLWEQANGVDITTMSDPTRSPLPLLTPPGLGGLLAPTSTHVFPAPVTSVCDSHQLPANSFSTALSLRENPNMNPYDVGIPGQTVHEALYMTGALGNCNVTPADAPGSFVALNSLVNGESQNFWPILAGFGQGVTQVQAAVSTHAQVATVWLGSNDLLKVALSQGAAPVTAPQSVHDDIAAIVRKLQGAGSKVVVANLVDVMSAATFIPQPAYQPTLQAYITGLLEAQGVPAAQAAGAGALYSNAYAAQETAQTGLGANGYFTINALFATLQTAAAQIPAHAPPVAPTIPASYTVPDAVANNVKALNAAYNQEIAQAVSDTGAALADQHALFAQIEAAGGAPVNPPVCCSLVYRGGLTSLDGLHPSNTGYALIANVFINALDTAYNLGIPPVNVGAVYASDPYAPGSSDSVVSGFARVAR